MTGAVEYTVWLAGELASTSSAWSLPAVMPTATTVAGHGRELEPHRGQGQPGTPQRPWHPPQGSTYVTIATPINPNAVGVHVGAGEARWSSTTGPEHQDDGQHCRHPR
jgi:hypothetical protein